MTPVPLLNGEGLTVGRAALAARLAEQPIKPHLIHETVVAELAGRRAGTHSTRTRAQVRGGGSKPWRQKGTGRSRQGSIRAPQWTGGGIVFGPTPRSYGGKVNRKVREQAFRAALRAQADRGSLALMDPTGWETPSTKRAAEYLRQAPEDLAGRPLLVVLDAPDGVDGRSFRNIPGVDVVATAGLQTVDVVGARALLVERAAWERLTGGPAEVEEVAPPRKKPARTRAKKTPARARKAGPEAATPEAEGETPAPPEAEAATSGPPETEAATPAAEAPEADAGASAAEAEAAEPEPQPEADAEPAPRAAKPRATRSRAAKPRAAAEPEPEDAEPEAQAAEPEPEAEAAEPEEEETS